MPEPNISTSQDVGMWQIVVRWWWICCTTGCNIELWARPLVVLYNTSVAGVRVVEFRTKLFLLLITRWACWLLDPWLRLQSVCCFKLFSLLKLRNIFTSTCEILFSKNYIDRKHGIGGPHFLRCRIRSARKPWKLTFAITPLSFDASSPRNPREYPHKLCIARNYSHLRYVFAADSMGLSSFRFSWWALKTHVFWNRVRNGHSRPSKVIGFGTNRKRVCNFLLVINSNLGPILPRFRDIAGFLLSTATPPLFHPNFGVFPLD